MLFGRWWVGGIVEPINISEVASPTGGTFVFLSLSMSLFAGEEEEEEERKVPTSARDLFII